ncbi:MAG: hypothetical protein HY018_02405 [Hydrogenophilales bacterium]|nr:hypothetical protein [Hydrogenophilales bacterium]
MEPISPNTQTTHSPNDTGANAAAEHARRSLDEARASAAELAARSSDTLRVGAARAREAISQTTDQAAQYVRAQPLKSLLMAAAAGAAIALLAGAVNKRHGHST